MQTSLRLGLGHHDVIAMPRPRLVILTFLASVALLVAAPGCGGDDLKQNPPSNGGASGKGGSGGSGGKGGQAGERRPGWTRPGRTGRDGRRWWRQR